LTCDALRYSNPTRTENQEPRTGLRSVLALFYKSVRIAIVSVTKRRIAHYAPLIVRHKYQHCTSRFYSLTTGAINNLVIREK